MRLIRMLAEAGIPTLDYIEYDSDEDLTDGWQYISVAQKNTEVSVKCMGDRETKIDYVKDCKRKYGNKVKIYIADFIKNNPPTIVIVGEHSVEFVTDTVIEERLKIKSLIEKLKQVKGIPMPFSVFLVKDSEDDSYKVTKFITIR